MTHMLGDDPTLTLATETDILIEKFQKITVTRQSQQESSLDLQLDYQLLFKY